MSTDLVWMIATLAAALYCLTKAIIDLRARRYVWATVGLLIAGVLLLTPIQPHAFKVDLPVAGQ